VWIVPLALLAAYVLWNLWLGVQLKREFGSYFADMQSYARSVTLPISPREADGLVHRGLRELFGSSETNRRGEGKIEGEGFGVELVPVPEGTRIDLSGGGRTFKIGIGARFPSAVREPREGLDRLADWLERASLDEPLAEDHPTYRHYGVA
jgi:hypothetical protein